MSKKICFVASCGGHLEELLCLRQLAEENCSYWITEKSENCPVRELQHAYYVPQMNRHEQWFVIHLIKLFLKAIFITAKERPDVVITTGALISFPFCVIAKICGKKIIYIETYARITGKSLTGRLIYPFADLFLVQWESLLKYYPKAKYTGGIF